MPSWMTCRQSSWQQHSSTDLGHDPKTGRSELPHAITEPPDLFGAAIDKVGLADTLRLETTANGVPNIAEFGSTKTEEGFKVKQ
jgi:prolyl oligopeptidase